MNTRRIASHIASIPLIAVLLFAGMKEAASQARWVALVVGNSAYRAEAQLANPGNDARLMARTLAGLGFTLIGGGPQLDLNKSRFDAAVRDFGKALPGSDVALFYYSGHGMQVQGTNWLVPLDANPTRVQDLDFQMVDANLVLKQMEGAGTKLNMMILDACRNNPFGGRGVRGNEPGLAQMRAPVGTLISFATQPGNTAMDGTGSNSPYTIALAQAMQQPGLDVLRMFNRVGVVVKQSTNGEQLPWVSSSPIEGEFTFVAARPGPVVPVPAPTVPVANRPGPAPVPPAAFAGLAQRVAAKAQAANLPSPAILNIVPPTADVPPEIARFVGAWGPGAFGNRPSYASIVVVEQVTAAGDVRGTRTVNDACADRSCSHRFSAVKGFTGRVDNGIMSFDVGDSIWKQTFEFDGNGGLSARNLKDGVLLGYGRFPKIE